MVKRVVMFLLMVTGLMMSGCGTAGVSTTPNVDPRCQANAPCNFYDSLTAYNWWSAQHQNDLGLALEAKASGDPTGYYIKVFENWFFTTPIQ